MTELATVKKFFAVQRRIDGELAWLRYTPEESHRRHDAWTSVFEDAELFSEIRDAERALMFVDERRPAGAAATVVAVDLLSISNRLPISILNDLSVIDPAHAADWAVLRDFLLPQGRGDESGLICGNCGKRSTPLMTRYGRRDDCECGWRSWGGKPLSSPETLRLRKRAHKLMDAMWADGSHRRGDLYERLADAMEISLEKCHFAHMDQEQLEQAIPIIQSWSDDED